jgi:predicted PurR-regulated permease PerM
LLRCPAAARIWSIDTVDAALGEQSLKRDACPQRQQALSCPATSARAAEMSSSQASTGAPSASPRAPNILAGAAVLALLYFGREVLVPVTLAAILSLLLAPAVRGLKRLGMGRMPAMLTAVIAVCVLLVGLAGMIAAQVAAMAARLPQYESTIRDKIKVIEAITIGRMEAMEGEAGRMIERLSAAPVPPAPPGAGLSQVTLTPAGAVPVEMHERPRTSFELVRQVAASVWGPLGTAGIVLVVLAFALLEYESLRDRFIRLAGSGDLRATTHALDDAGKRLSRYFVSQLAVNVGVGALLGIGLAVLGIPQSPLWATLTVVLRFVPYVGIVIAALSTGLIAAAIDPGWAPALLTLGLFAVVEVFASQAVEPLLYGHSTGLSPLSIVVAAIFWSWIWGPVGLLLSTPLTLCLVVAGRYVKALAFLDILLGNSPALTQSQRFYQRALAGDADEIVAAAREYLKRHSFARYCDDILMPALRLMGIDLGSGSIGPEQLQRVRATIATVIEELGPDTRSRRRRRARATLLDEPSVGVHLRHLREAAIGRWQGPLEVPAGSVALCIGLGSIRDDLVTEILVRVLRERDLDARHLSVEDVAGGPPPGARAEIVAMVFLVTMSPAEEWVRAGDVAAALHQRFQGAVFVCLMPDDPLPEAEARNVGESVDLVVHSFEDAAQQAGPAVQRRRGPPTATPSA